MRLLKAKYRKGLNPIIIPSSIILTKIIKRKKIGRWCEYYEGRLPFPIECQWNKEIPLRIDKPN